MEITRRSDYAFRILRSAYRHKDNYVSIAEVAEEEHIPYAFARTIQHDLAQAGYLRTVRGARGGLVLDIDPSSVTLLDVMRTLQGPVEVAPCATDPSSCELSGGCTVNRIWVAANEALNTLLGSLTLQDVFDGNPDGAFLDDAKAAMQLSVAQSLDEILGGEALSSCKKTAAN